MEDLKNMSMEEILNLIGIVVDDEDIRGLVSDNAEATKKLEEIFIARNNFYEEGKKDVRSKFSREEFNQRMQSFVLEQMEEDIDKEKLVLLTLYKTQLFIEKERRNLKKDEIEALNDGIKEAIRLLGDKDVNVVNLVFDADTKTDADADIKSQEMQNNMEELVETVAKALEAKTFEARRFSRNSKNILMQKNSQEETTDEVVKEIRVLNSVEIVNCIKHGKRLESINKQNHKKEDRLNGIDKSIGLKNLLNAISVEDFNEFVPAGTEIAEAMGQQCIWNTVKKYFDNRPKLKNDKSRDEIQKVQEEEDKILSSEEYKQTLIETIRANIKYIDIDKLLLMSAYKDIQFLEKNEQLFKNNEIKEEVEKEVRELLEMIQAKTRNGAFIKIPDNEEKYDVDKLEEDLTRFKSGRYISKEIVENAKRDVLSGEINLNDIEEDVVSSILFGIEETYQLAENSEENIIYLINEDLLAPEVIVDTLVKRNECSKELFDMLIERKLIDYDPIIDLYEKGIITADMISKMQNEELLARFKESSRENVRKSYEDISNPEKEATPEQMEMFNKYASLYKKTNLEGKTEEEINESSMELIDSLENYNSETLEGLYQYGIITLEAAADWGVDLNNMLLHGSIKPTDLKDLYEKSIIQIENIKSVLLNKDISYEEKLDLIYSTFDGDSEEQQNLRDELVNMIEMGEGYKVKPKGKRIKPIGPKEKSKEYVSDPHARWKLIASLDKDYSKKFLPKGKEVTDGHRVFLLPNLGKIVIERMYEKKGGRTQIAYGNATYILETDEFFGNIDDIIKDNAINRPKLVEMAEDKEATKIRHYKNWGKEIKKHFKINEENERYTEEEIAEIDKTINSILNSRKERE